MNLNSLKNSLTIDKIDKIIESTFKKGTFDDFIVVKNREQMWDGLTSEKKQITPKYSQDPYFKTKEAAIKYANWKQNITPNTKRDPDTPNLFINGHFYNSLNNVVNATNIQVKTTSPLGSDIVKKYPTALGLINDNKMKLIKMFTPYFKQEFRIKFIKNG